MKILGFALNFYYFWSSFSFLSHMKVIWVSEKKNTPPHRAKILPPHAKKLLPPPHPVPKYGGEWESSCSYFAFVTCCKLFQNAKDYFDSPYENSARKRRRKNKDGGEGEQQGGFFSSSSAVGVPALDCTAWMLTMAAATIAMMRGW